MTRWILALIGITLLGVPAANSQGFVANIWYEPSGGNAPLTTECEGSTPLPDGRIIRIFQDVDFDGPDPEDPQPTVCNNPPECLDGPVGTVNFNQFLTNGEDQLLGQGYFITTTAFLSVSLLPPGVPFWYVRVYEPDGTTVLWTSSTFFLSTGYQEISLLEDGMTCGQGGPQCLVIDETE